MPKFATTVAIRQDYINGVHIFHDGDEVPKWALTRVGKHVLRDENAAEDVVDENADDNATGDDGDAGDGEETPHVTEIAADGEEGDEGDAVDPHDPTVFDEDDEDDVAPYAKWTNEELRDELIARSLETTGKKAQLVARLEADDE